MRRIALLGAGLIAALAVTGCASAGAPGGAGTVRDCTASAYHAIRAHEAISGVPASCRGLSRAQVNDAASVAIRQASGSGPKSAWRKRAGAAAPWVSALLTGPVLVIPPADAISAAGGPGAPGAPGGAGAPGGSRLGGVSELAVQVAALLAWLATAISGGYVLVRWLRAGGGLRRRSATAAPSGAIIGHAGVGLAGLVLWLIFMLSGWMALAWAAVVMLGPGAGLGMVVLLLGLPSPRPSRARRAQMPVFVIAAHGLFAATVLLLVITAAIGAG